MAAEMCFRIASHCAEILSLDEWRSAEEAGKILMNPLIFAKTHLGQISWRMTGLDNPVSAKRSHEPSDQAC